LKINNYIHNFFALSLSQIFQATVGDGGNKVTLSKLPLPINPLKLTHHKTLLNADYYHIVAKL
jgi:hypothetical protein